MTPSCREGIHETATSNYRSLYMIRPHHRESALRNISTKANRKNSTKFIGGEAFWSQFLLFYLRSVATLFSSTRSLIHVKVFQFNEDFKSFFFFLIGQTRANITETP